jgi:diguanylate cyclase (GGDEF)-like protein
MAKAFKERTVLPFFVLLSTLVVGVALANGLAILTAGQILGVRVRGDDVARAAFVCLFSAPMLWLFGVSPLRRVSLADRERDTERERALIAEADRQQFGARVHRAMEMADDEDAAVAVAGRSMAVALPDSPSELLLADSSRAHYRLAAVGAADGPHAGCDVRSPAACPAARRAQTAVFESSEDLDACPHLRGRPSGAMSAVCVPVTIMGKPMGVIHGTAADGSPPSRDQIGAVEMIASVAGSRISLLRAMARTQLQAATDPLTGLLNRRVFENHGREILLDGTAAVVAMGDLDTFKSLNDTYGHDTGDRALRLFAQTLRASLRPEDLACRYGGEEFVILLPRCSLSDASYALERIQEQLVLNLSQGDVPAFTVSFGVAEAGAEDSLEGLIHAADAALLRAKASGRNRVVVAGAPALELRPFTDAD